MKSKNMNFVDFILFYFYISSNIFISSLINPTFSHDMEKEDTFIPLKLFYYILEYFKIKNTYYSFINFYIMNTYWI